ncbi:hypothetical protein NDU88_005758 [Pleurodeles waltl]|uniref:Secreted protein n=1 Tax=Pleurodeles waltl TaxID=8319 RepID=A0AAV7UIX6_PLEWA|nr:hypothetical protein NDU88_005758 [Pleurodeles waltl]
MGLTGPQLLLLHWATSSISSARSGGDHLCLQSRASFSLHCSSETLLHSTKRQHKAPRLRSDSKAYWLVPADLLSGRLSQAWALLCVGRQPNSPFTAAGSLTIEYFCHHFRIAADITGFSVTLPCRDLLAPPIMSSVTLRFLRATLGLVVYHGWRTLFSLDWPVYLLLRFLLPPISSLRHFWYALTPA